MLLHHILYTVYKWGSFCTIPILALDVYVIIYYVKYIFGFLVHSKTQENLMRPLIPGYNVTGVNILYFIFSVTAYSSDTYGFKPFDIIYNINCQTINFQNLTNYLLDNLNHPTGFCLSETATQLVCQQNDSDCKKFKNAQINNQSVFLNVRNVMESNCCQNDKDCNSLEDDNFEGKKCFFPESSAVMAKIKIKKSQHYRIVADMKDFIDNG
ncbi:hypothetical protein A3Q56_05204 [Intoshia linei]|uniref:Uncharacterized protein n=1 Tax=Intoshia linei TaxID=1819745 RepID=A0A177AYY5_9BILA|nr:hypothetical protein A3Q56_05204 [Intoshia linei]